MLVLWKDFRGLARRKIPSAIFQQGALQRALAAGAALDPKSRTKYFPQI